MQSVTKDEEEEEEDDDVKDVMDVKSVGNGGACWFVCRLYGGGGD